MDIEQMKDEGGHGVCPEVIRRVEYFLYSMKWKVAPFDLSIRGLDDELLEERPKGLTLSASNNSTKELPYRIFITFTPDGGMSVTFDVDYRNPSTDD